jgi:HEAT repeat protein
MNNTSRRDKIEKAIIDNLNRELAIERDFADFDPDRLTDRDADDGQIREARQRKVQACKNVIKLEAALQKKWIASNTFLGEALRDSNSYVRKSAILAFSMLTDPDVSSLSLVIKEDSVLTVRAEAARALGRIGSPQAIELLFSALRNVHGDVWAAIFETIRETGDPRVTQTLFDIIKERKAPEAASALMKCGRPGVQILYDAMISRENDERVAAAWALGQKYCTHEIQSESVPLLRRALKDSDSKVRTTAAEALASMAEGLGSQAYHHVLQKAPHRLLDEDHPLYKKLRTTMPRLWMLQSVFSRLEYHEKGTYRCVLKQLGINCGTYFKGHLRGPLKILFIVIIIGVILLAIALVIWVVVIPDRA